MQESREAQAGLDDCSTPGKVRNQLDATDGPEPSAETVDVGARTSLGDIRHPASLRSA
jgi:hypothetical protein